MEMQNIALNLTVDEINLILKSLGQLPFAEVYAVIHKIQQQASAQMSANQQDESQ